MERMRFGAFTAPHHPLGESLTLLFRRDIDHAKQLDDLGYDEYWVGEHHSSGWETIGSPELLLAAAAEHTRTIRLGTGVISLPYHHPFSVAQRLAQLDHQSRGRVIFGSGPGALPSDAHTLGIDPMVQRDRQDEALGVIRRLLRGEDRFSHESEWFTMKDAQLQILPIQEDMECATASSLSPSGMVLAGKHGTGVLSIASTSSEGLAALPTQWAFAEESALKHGQSVSRRNWRVLMSWHIAESKEQAQMEALMGLQRWQHEYNVDILGRPGAERVEDPWVLMEQVAGGAAGGTAVVGTPDDLVAAIRRLYEVTGGFGVVIGFAHDWANHEATKRSWDLVARYVIPEINGQLRHLRGSAAFLTKNQAQLMGGATQAVMAKIAATPGAMEALAVTMAERANATQGSSEWRPVQTSAAGVSDTMTFRALLSSQVDKTYSHEVVELDDDRLPAGDVTIAVDYSSLNYKDGLILTGRSRLVREYPHVGGIDLAGTVVDSQSPRWKPGQRVLLTGFRVGEIWWGGYATKARVKAEWLCEVPDRISTRQTMAIGTAGFTAMLAIDMLEKTGLRPGQGPVLVTGAAGGVGSTAVHLLARLGYEVVASTGRAAERRDELVAYGASDVIERDSIADVPERPLLSERWAGVVDAVGGSTLSHVLAELKYGAGVAACGLAGGDKITSTVIPFLLRGNNLLGIDSVMRPVEGRQEVWQRTADTMDLAMLDAMTTEIGLAELPAAAEAILAGQVAGRWVVNTSR